MNFIASTFSNTCNFFITEEAINDLILNAVSDTKGVKLAQKPRIIFNKNHDNVEIVVDVKVKRNILLKEGLENIKNEIQRQYLSLLNIKPTSIRVCFIEYY
ncbi:Uncharacterised protein [Mycoplasmopsis maculosa]|uniref:Uncharacterized protein n=1 Tax=Mycoplasmopsis maculosa TaxID=114885 RepID=A0A449B3V1_9BACT|nr:hypothetical protein [Mycoplasmopsis maculosa]VEU75249.1 Uncharacterised protein [Mycoplasmopsis maculosa]